MPKSKEISIDLRKLIIQDYKNGMGYGKIAKKYNRCKSTIQRVIKSFKKNGGFASAPRTGRPRVTNSRDDTQIVREIKKDPTTSARFIKESLQINVSERTIQRRIREEGFSSHYKIRKPFISNKNMKARLAFAKKYFNMPLSFWERVIWSDESKFEFKNTKRREKVWRKSNERLQSKCVQSTIKFGGGSVLIWGCFSYSGISDLVHIEGKMTGESYVNMLSTFLEPSARRMGLGHNFIYQQDNDPKHTSRVAKEYFRQNSIELLEWPAQSPDLNPIEHLWQYLDEKIDRSSCRSKKAEFFQKLQETWNKIPEELLKRLVHSMPRRLLAVVNAKGVNTKYSVICITL